MARKTKAELPDDPLWYKDAVIYQLHIKSFFDSNNDGVGDFESRQEDVAFVHGQTPGGRPH